MAETNEQQTGLSLSLSCRRPPPERARACESWNRRGGGRRGLRGGGARALRPRRAGYGLRRQRQRQRPRRRSGSGTAKVKAKRVPVASGLRRSVSFGSPARRGHSRCVALFGGL
ncbi:hypothetical protein BS78_10G279000 [Paspalum vaginatum]|nr:hypothetical protein BS78_10G279000 [Paspalum vaginatum]